jgi:hypothetical protein
MKEIDEKEKMLKEAIKQNNQYLDKDGEIVLPSGELTAAAAASKFSSMRGNIYRVDKIVNPEIPKSKIIEELPEDDSDDEESSKLDNMLQEAESFINEYEIDKTNQSSHEVPETQLLNLLAEAKTEDEK